MLKIDNLKPEEFVEILMKSYKPFSTINVFSMLSALYVTLDNNDESDGFGIIFQNSTGNNIVNYIEFNFKTLRFCLLSKNKRSGKVEKSELPKQAVEDFLKLVSKKGYVINLTEIK